MTKIYGNAFSVLSCQLQHILGQICFIEFNKGLKLFKYFSNNYCYFIKSISSDNKLFRARVINFHFAWMDELYYCNYIH